MNYLAQYLKKKKMMLAAVLLMLIGQVAGTLLVPYLIAGIIDRGIMNGDMDVILTIGAQMLVVALATSAISVWGSYLSADFAAAFGRDMREKLFRKAQDLSVKDFDGIGASSMITRTTSDITNIQQTLCMVLQMILPAPLIAAASIVMTSFASPQLTLIPIASIVLFVGVAYAVIKRSGPLSKQIQLGMDKINQVVRESIIGVRVIRAFDNAGYEKDRSDKAFGSYADTMISLNRLFAVLNPVVWLVMGLSMAAIVWFGGLLTGSGQMAVGEIAAVTEYTIQTLGYLIMATFATVTLPKMRACLDRLDAVLDIRPQITDAARAAEFQGGVDALTFENVTFSYRGAEMPVLHYLTFRCRAGQTTAIIGGTGSGKSTIAGLLLRLHDADSGCIRLGGTDIRTLTQHSLRDQIGYVPQRAFLFGGSIADNLRMGKKNATGAEMRAALTIAQALPFVEGLPAGLEAPVSQSGTNFSGGQKQRLSIARALIKNSPVFVFDDSFSALDYRTDSALRKALKSELADRVLLIIAQRVSTIIDADQIIVLDEGHIVGAGRHNELLRTCTVYQDIVKSQQAAEQKSSEKEREAV